jgi:type I restriction enzyme, S subunit
MGIEPIVYFKKTLLDLSRDPFARLDFDYFYNMEKFGNQFRKDVKFKKLRDIVTLIETGQAVERTDYAATESDYIHIVPRDIKNGILDIREPIYLNSEKGEDLLNYRLVEGDILVAISSNCGDSAFFVPPVSDKHYSISHYVLRLKVNPKLYDADFLVYYLNHPRIKIFFRAIEAGKLQQNLSKVYLRNFPIIDLPLEEQKTIALSLRAKTKEIRLKQTEIENLRKESTDLVWGAIGEQN